MTISPAIDTITALITEAAQTLILPRFRRLRPEDIEDKSTTVGVEDLVTVVDREAEEWLTAALRRLDPSATVVGEKAVHARPELLDVLATDGPVWLLDPIDGTKNFARGADGFGVLLTRVQAGQAQMAWLALPARDEMFVAVAGSGAVLNGARIRVPPAAISALRGVMLRRYMPAAVRTRLTRAAAGHLAVVPDSACGAVDYMEILRGRMDFAVYHRLLPWDHVAPALILTEAGGCVEHDDGRAYNARSINQVTVAARSPAAARQVREALAAGG